MTIKLELYKAYKMRNGGVGVSVCYDKTDNTYRIWIKEKDMSVFFNTNGKPVSVYKDHEWDIISEWQEPVTHTARVALSEGGTFYFISGPLDKAMIANGFVKGSAKVTITEGEFDNDSI